MLEYLPLPDASDETVDSLYLCLEILLRIFQSLGAGAILISAMTSLTVTFTDNTTTVLGYAQTAIGFGYLIGPAVGSGLFKLGGFAAIFATVGAIMVLVGIIAWLIFPKNDPAHTENENSVSVRKILFHKNVIAALSLTAFLGTLWSSIEPILEPELREEYGLKQEISALTFLLVSVTFTIGSPIIAIALDKLSWLTPLFVMMCGFVINTVAFLFLGPCPLFTGFTRPLWLVLLCLAFMGLGIALELVSSLDLLGFSSTDETGKKVCLDKSSKALLSAFWSSAYALGDFIGPTYSGIMTEYVSFGWTMTAYALACFFVVFIVVFVQTYKCLVKLGAKNTLADEDDETLPLLL
ncbi:MFS-type transporter SLC18B1-like [Watersipora subatra]|uniref:MFS-type transporter SLC18B1-like n=1 Tax=Watersipora subatra TaxID=2589382 RepID=UPI00355B364A